MGRKWYLDHQTSVSTRSIIEFIDLRLDLWNWKGPTPEFLVVWWATEDLQSRIPNPSINLFVYHFSRRSHHHSHHRAVVGTNGWMSGRLKERIQVLLVFIAGTGSLTRASFVCFVLFRLLRFNLFFFFLLCNTFHSLVHEHEVHVPVCCECECSVSLPLRRRLRRLLLNAFFAISFSANIRFSFLFFFREFIYTVCSAYCALGICSKPKREYTDYLVFIADLNDRDPNWRWWWRC